MDSYHYCDTEMLANSLELLTIRGFAQDISNRVITSHHMQAYSSVVCIVLEVRLPDEEEVPEEKKSCKAEIRDKGVGNKYREYGKCITCVSCCYKPSKRSTKRPIRWKSTIEASKMNVCLS